MTDRIRHNANERSGSKNVGDEIIRGLTGMRDALRDGVHLPDRFTMRTIELDLEPRDWSPEEIKELREHLRASQAVFAKLIGTSIKTVQAWEQGNSPPPMARRLLDCIEQNQEPWKKILQEAATH